GVRPGSETVGSIARNGEPGADRTVQRAVRRSRGCLVDGHARHEVRGHADSRADDGQEESAMHESPYEATRGSDCRARNPAPGSTAFSPFSTWLRAPRTQPATNERRLFAGQACAR